MKTTINWHVYLLVKNNKFREYENKVSWFGNQMEITLREKVTWTEVILNNDDIANACIDYFEKMLLSGNSHD